MKQPVSKRPKTDIKEKKDSKTTDYQKYLRSKQWRETHKWFREHIFTVPKCYICGRTEEEGAVLSLHHNDYRYLGKEKENPHCLLMCCKGCHLHLHRNKAAYKYLYRK